MTKGDTTMFSFQKHFLILRLSKYLKQNLPAVRDTLDSRSYLDMLKLNDDSYDEDFLTMMIFVMKMHITDVYLLNLLSADLLNPVPRQRLKTEWTQFRLSWIPTIRS